MLKGGTMPKYIERDALLSYMNGIKPLPSDIGKADILGKKSDSNIYYYSWNLKFNNDLAAGKEDNLGQDEVQIIFNLTCDIEWTIGKGPEDKKYQHVIMKKGDVCIYRNDDIGTSMQYTHGLSFQFKSLQMKTERFKELLSSYFSPEDKSTIEDIVYNRAEVTGITPDMYRILSEIDSIDRFKEFRAVFLEAKMIELTALVLFEIVKNKESAGDYLNLSDKTDRSEVEKLRERIQIYPYKDYNAEIIAEEMAMSVSKLNRVFRKLYGTSMHSYVQDMRLEYAASLLVKGKVNVTEAATSSGYNNMSHFSKAFKNRFGVTPKKFVSEKC